MSVTSSRACAAQDELLDLARWRPGKRVNQLQTLGPVRLRDAAVSLGTRASSSKSSSPTHERAGPLAEALVGHGHDRDVAHRRVGVQELLDLGHRHLLAAAVDHVLDPAGDPHVAVGVDPGQIAGAVPAVGGDRLGGQRRGGSGSPRTGNRCGPRSCPPRRRIGPRRRRRRRAGGRRQGPARRCPRPARADRRARTRSPGSSRSCPRLRRPRPRAPRATVARSSRGIAAPVATNVRRPLGPIDRDRRRPESGRPGTASPPAQT